MVKDYDQITEGLLDEQFEGKNHGAIRLVVNTINKKIYAVPPKGYHIDTTGTLAGKNEAELRENPQSVSYLVPAIILIDKGIVIELVIGKSSLESRIHVEHSTTELATAELLVKKFIERSYDTLKKAA